MNPSLEEMKQEAIPLIVFNPKTKAFDVTQYAEKFLCSVKGPIGVLGVAGMYRTGKSYLLNRMLLNRQSGFGVGPTINPCTKGLWVWSRPVKGTTVDQQNINVLIIDSEGIGALDEENNHDMRIFSLVLLISSYFLYNSTGSIDQNALQNLSLVVNLTKHIQIKSNQSPGMDEIDPQEYANYLPSFLWVVRDFALQLLDQEGEPITAKEYLEKALKQQNGFSDSIQQKNRIRRLLRTFFKDRDCCTMIRPLTDQSKLQELDTMELSELRAEFVDQVTQLRRKVLNRMKPKMLNGKILTGEMLYGVIQSYVNAINKGAVPNIESAWSYICKNECTKALHESVEIFDRFMKEPQSKLPMDDPVLKEYYDQAKSEALKHFSKKGVGAVAQDVFRNLKIKLKQKYNNIKQENEKESRKAAQIFLSQAFMGTEQKLKDHQYQNFREYERELRQFQDYFMINGPTGPERRMILMDFIQRVQAQGADFFIMNIQNELNQLAAVKEDHIQKLSSELRQVSTLKSKQRDNMHEKNRVIEMNLAEAQARESAIREQYNQILKTKEHLEMKIQEKVDQSEREQARIFQEQRSKTLQSQEHKKELERRMMATESQNKKQVALLEQKLTFLEKTIDELTKREKDQGTDLKTQKKQHQTVLKEITTKHDSIIKDLRKKLDDAQERIAELETSLSKSESKYECDRASYSDTEKALKSKFDSITKELELQQRKFAKQEEQHRDRIEKLKLQTEEERERHISRIQELERTTRQAVDECKNIKAQSEKDAAVKKQKLEFLELQYHETKKQLEESQRSQNKLLKTMQEKSADMGHADKLMQSQNEEHLKERQALNERLQEQRDSMNIQIQTLTDRNNKLQLQLKVIVSDSQKEVNDLKARVQELEDLNSQLDSRSKTQQSSKMKIIQESEKRHQAQITLLENELEDLKIKSDSELRSLQARSEQTLAQLKNFYEMEKERVENRLRDEKERQDKRFNQANQEWESRLREEQTRHEDQREMLQDEIRDNQIQYQVQTNQFEHEISLLQQKIEQLQEHLSQNKESLTNIQNQNNAAMEQQNNAFTKQRQHFVDKIEQLTKQITKKDREIVSTETKAQNMEQQLKKKQKAAEDKMKETQNEKNDFQERLEELRMKNQQLSDELMQKKLQLGRETALMKQNIEFQEKKIGELKENLDQNNKRHDEREKQQREEAQRDLKDAAEKYQAEKEITEAKYEEKRRTLKEFEASLHRKTGEMDREKAIMDEKYNNLILKKEDMERKYLEEIEQLKNDLEMSSSSSGKGVQELRNENAKLKEEIAETERMLSETKTSYDRDGQLWENKYNFLVEQKDQSKKDLVEAQSNFERTLEQLQKRSGRDKEQQQGSSMALFQTMETKYKNQIKDLNESHQKLYNELFQKNKSLQKDMRDLNEQLTLEQRGKMSEHGTLQKKLQDYRQRQAKLIAEVEELKSDRDMKLMDHQKIVDRDRELQKAKRQEAQAKCKEAEQKRDAMVFEHEKQRAKWSLERDHLLNQKAEQADLADKFAKEKDRQIRELARLQAKIDRLQGAAARSAIGLVNQSALNTTRFSTQPFGGQSGLRSTRDLGKTFIGDGGENKPPSILLMSGDKKYGAPSPGLLREENNSTPSTGTLEAKSVKSGMSEEGSPGKDMPVSSLTHYSEK